MKRDFHHVFVFRELWKDRFIFCETWSRPLLSGAPNDQFVEKCIIIPQLMKIYVIKAFSGVFQYSGKNIIFPFFPARHIRNFPARKIKLVGFPASCKVSSLQAEKWQFSTSYVKMGVAKGLKSTLQWRRGGGGGRIPTSFQSFPTKLGLKC